MKKEVYDWVAKKRAKGKSVKQIEDEMVRGGYSVETAEDAVKEYAFSYKEIIFASMIFCFLSILLFNFNAGSISLILLFAGAIGMLTLKQSNWVFVSAAFMLSIILSVSGIVGESILFLFLPFTFFFIPLIITRHQTKYAMYSISLMTSFLISGILTIGLIELSNLLLRDIVINGVLLFILIFLVLIQISTRMIFTRIENYLFSTNSFPKKAHNIIWIIIIISTLLISAISATNHYKELYHSNEDMDGDTAKKIKEFIDAESFSSINKNNSKLLNSQIVQDITEEKYKTREIRNEIIPETKQFTKLFVNTFTTTYSDIITSKIGKIIVLLIYLDDIFPPEEDISFWIKEYDRKNKSILNAELLIKNWDIIEIKQYKPNEDKYLQMNIYNILKENEIFSLFEQGKKSLKDLLIDQEKMALTNRELLNSHSPWFKEATYTEKLSQVLLQHVIQGKRTRSEKYACGPKIPCLIDLAHKTGDWRICESLSDDIPPYTHKADCIKEVKSS